MSATYGMGRSFRSSRRKDVAMTKQGHDVSRIRVGQKALSPRHGDAAQAIGRHDCTLGALILIYGYLIVARVKAGRLCSRPDPESCRNADPQSSKGKAPELRDLL
ncbi:hypothetical protein Sjap_005070 [Stephania japonica]|uniref:Uncharacterized protein n=1 Tax=Stephania japonica TaxID=461633 RepID=A0AAP0K3D9_9MAGN